MARRKCWSQVRSQDVKSLNMFHHWLLTCKIVHEVTLEHDLCRTVQIVSWKSSGYFSYSSSGGGGRNGPTDYIHNVVLPCCRVLHQSCTRAFIIIFTWESTESCIWSTIIPAQVLVLKRRDMICIDAQVWNISTTPWSYKEENVDFCKESFRVLHVELIEKLRGLSHLEYLTGLMLYHHYFAHEEKKPHIENEVSWNMNKKTVQINWKKTSVPKPMHWNSWCHVICKVDRLSYLCWPYKHAVTCLLKTSLGIFFRREAAPYELQMSEGINGIIIFILVFQSPDFFFFLESSSESHTHQPEISKFNTNVYFWYDKVVPQSYFFLPSRLNIIQPNLPNTFKPPDMPSNIAVSLYSTLLEILVFSDITVHSH